MAIPITHGLRDPGFMLRAMPSRKISVALDLHGAGYLFFDDEYGIPLGTVSLFQLGQATTTRRVLDLIAEACREPTSLDILTYAQLTGPHVTGAS